MRWSGLEQQFYIYTGWRNVFSMVLNTSLFLLISSLYWFFKQGQIEREKYLIVKNEKLEAELSFLRTQISPHFIFNTLNNVYTLALQKHDNTAPMVAKLSSLLRHILYESNQGQILLRKEIDTLKQYIELHLLKKPRSQNIDFYTEGALNSWKITPMLLINFVENAFKHSGIDQNENAWVKINSEISEDGLFVFSTENTVFSISDNETGGIGLKNMRRQLEIDYPNTHTLIIKNEQGIFSVHLTIKLHT
jgi:LytS/YehU family sensor histidine kinase